MRIALPKLALSTVQSMTNTVLRPLIYYITIMTIKKTTF